MEIETQPQFAFATATGAPLLAISNFAFDVQIDFEKPGEEYFAQYWAEIETFLHGIYEATGQSNICFQHYYEIIGNLCDNEFEKDLHAKLTTFYVSKFRASLLSISLENERIIGSVEREWRKINNCLNTLSEVFKRFECSYLYSTKTPSFESFILRSLSDLLTGEFQQLLQGLIDELIGCFKDIREGREYAADHLKSLMDLIAKIGSYETLFMPRFIECSQAFYNERLEMHKTPFDLRKYLEEIEFRIQQESETIASHLSKATGKTLLDLVQKTLITGNLEQIFQSGFDDIIATKDRVNMQRLFVNMRNTDGLEFLKKNWAQHIKKRGEQIVSIENQDEITNQLLEFFHELDEIIATCFDDLPLLKQAKNHALEHVMSLKVNTLAELISKHLDNKLKKSNKTMQEHDATQKEVDDALELFRYLQAKDIFEAFYNKRLARRLLMNLSYSFELERHVLDRLRSECGDQYTSKADEILKDVNEAKQLNKDFSDYLVANKSEINRRNVFQVIVISSSSWPMKSSPLPQLIEPFNSFQKHFEKFYLQRFKGMCIKWQHETSTCDIQGLFNKEKYIFQVQLIQALILLCFNKKKQLSYTDFARILPLEEDELKKNLVSLYAMKDTQKLLNKSGETKKVEDHDIFEVNDEYVSKKKVVKVNSIFKKETKEEVQEITDKVLVERGYVLDASIVKILKSKKSIFHTELLKELFNDLKLPVNAQEVKKRIEGLIDKDYIKRDHDKLNLYHYVA